jgi:hypothetical protein
MSCRLPVRAKATRPRTVLEFLEVRKAAAGTFSFPPRHLDLGRGRALHFSAVPRGRGDAGPAPPVAIRLGVSACADIDGSSIGLPALLAFIAHFSDMPFPEPVAATGWFGRELGFPRAKFRAWTRERTRLGSGRLLVAGSTPSAPRPADPVSRPEDAAPLVWGFPWTRPRSRSG